VKNIFIGAIALILIGIGAYLSLGVDKDAENQVGENNTAVYSSPEIGFEFSYKTGPAGYVLTESTPEGEENLVRSLVLMTYADANKDIPSGGEGPAIMTILIFKNTEKQKSQAWADEHIAYSSINLKMGEVSEAVVGGANAIRYRVDGLYTSDNAIVAHGDNVYVLTGAFLDENSDLHRDFGPLVESVRFIPIPGQE